MVGVKGVLYKGGVAACGLLDINYSVGGSMLMSRIGVEVASIIDVDYENIIKTALQLRRIRI